MKALIVVDVQNDFLPGGALAVPHGDQVIPVINQLQECFSLIVATQDWHPSHHESFASNHQGFKVGEVIDLYGLPQVLWPDHCVQNTTGSDFAPTINTANWQQIFQKGTDAHIDSYSGFYDNGRKKDTGLAQHLRNHKVDEVYVVGLATDYCVKYTALDAQAEGFATTVVTDAVRAVNLRPEDGAEALQEMKNHGVQLLDSASILTNLA